MFKLTFKFNVLNYVLMLSYKDKFCVRNLRLKFKVVMVLRLKFIVVFKW